MICLQYVRHLPLAPQITGAYMNLQLTHYSIVCFPFVCPSGGESLWRVDFSESKPLQPTIHIPKDIGENSEV